MTRLARNIPIKKATYSALGEKIIAVQVGLFVVKLADDFCAPNNARIL